MAGEDEVIIKFKADTSAITGALDKATTVDKAAIDKATTSFNKLGQASAKALQTKNIKEVAVAFKTTDKEIKQAAVSMDKVVKSSTSLKAQLKALKSELAGLEEGSLEFNRVAKAAGELEDKIGDINQRVKALASDTGKIDALVDAATGLAGGFAAAQGAAALLGGENEDLQKTFVKVQSAMAVLQGIQALANTLNKDSAFSTIFLTKAQTAAAGATSVLGKAFGKLALALLNNPVTVIVVALTAAVVAIKAFSSGTSQAEEDQKALNAAMDDAQAAADNYVTALQGVIDQIKKRYDTEKRLAEAQGKDIADLTRKEFEEVNRVIESKLGQAVTAREIYAGKIAALQQELSAKEIEIENEKNAIKDAIIKQNNLNVLEGERQLLRDRLNSNQAAISELGDLERTAAQTIKDNETELTIFEQGELQKRLDAQKEAYKKRLEAEKQFRRQLEDLRVKNIDDENQEALAAENLRFKRAQEEVTNATINTKLKNELLEELEREHQDNITRIQKEEEAKRLQGLRDEITRTLEVKQEGNQQLIINDEALNAEVERITEERAQFKLVQEQLYYDEREKMAENYLNAFTSISNSLTLLGHENAELQKGIALFQIAVEQGKAIAAAISGAAQAATLTGPAAPFILGGYIVSMIAAVLSGFAQANAAVNSAPAFATGVEYLNGPGTSTSDSIHARLSKGERVVTADKNQRYWDELSAIHNGNFERLIQEKYVLPAMRNAMLNAESSRDERLALSMASALMDKWTGDNIELALRHNKKSASRDAKMIVSALRTRQSKRKY